MSALGMKRSAPETVESVDFAAMDIAARFDRIRRCFGGRVVASTSFGAQSAVLLHLLREHAPEIPVVCIDTGYLFPETYQYAVELERRLGTRVRFYTSPVSPARMEHTMGRLWEMGEDGLREYGLLRKVEPMNRALREHGAVAWISGLRRSQSDDRARRDFVEVQKSTTKLHPILDWSDNEVEEYYDRHDLPRHPLVARRFLSIGDWHSSRPAAEGEDAAATRHNGLHRECGLHLASDHADFQI